MALGQLSPLCAVLYMYEERHDRMSEQHDTRQEGGQIHSAPQGLQMFKNHIAAMKRGSWLLGGEREEIDEQSQSGLEDK